MGYRTFEELEPAQQKLLAAAEKAMEQAYNPYSKFYVGAALRTQGGLVFPGCNVENAAYGPTICAERSAIVSAVSAGHTAYCSIAIIARGEQFKTKQVTGPCGPCRQMLFEAMQVGESDIEVILSTTDKDKIVVTSAKRLLPWGFGPKDLNVDVSTYRKP